MRLPEIIICDASDRAWGVFDYSVIAGKVERNAFGTGQYRGFAPLDGGARRVALLLQADRDRGTSAEILLEQLAAAKLYHLDDPVACARVGRSPERIDVEVA
jgi:hypothetical protein